MIRNMSIKVRRGAGAIKAAKKDALQAGGWAMGKRWHEQFLPKHFTMGATERYSYAQREGAGDQAFFPNETHEILTNKHGAKYFRWKKDGNWYTSHGFAGYMMRKWNKFHHQLPLVFTGALRDAVTKSVTLVAGERGLRIIMKGPAWLKGFSKFRGRNGTGPDMYRELTTIIQDEAEALARTMKDAMAKYYASVRHKQ